MKQNQAVSPQELGQVVISKDEYDGLVKDAVLLNCLFTAGVDSWDGFVSALIAYEEIMKDDA